MLLNVSDLVQRAILKGLAALPLGLAYAAAVPLGILGYRLHEAGPHRGELHTLVTRALQVDRDEAERIIRANFIHLIKLLVEDARAAKLRRDWRDRVRIEGLANLQTALSGGKGAILLSAHLGNTELLMRGLPLLGLNVHAVVLRQPAGFFYRFLDDTRQAYGTKLIYTQELLTPSGVKRTLAMLRGGGVLALTGDPYGYGKNMVPFLGTRMAMPEGPVFFARLAGAPVVPLLIRRIGRGHLISIDPPLDLPLHDVQASLERCAAMMEGWIRAYPEQYYWLIHRPKRHVRPLKET
ncbi:MAG: lysophospholipid acyltransferase family protein [Patescibacteria group bacterium]